MRPGPAKIAARADDRPDDVLAVQAVLHAENDRVGANRVGDRDRGLAICIHLGRQEDQRVGVDPIECRAGADARDERLAPGDPQAVAVDRVGMRLPRDDGDVVTRRQLRCVHAPDRPGAVDDDVHRRCRKNS